jgi:predicted RNase H-related nuclease YkuK (DUF458 family)
MELKGKFKKFGGEFIPDIIEYLKEYIKENPFVTISVGCDSIQKSRRTVYAVTIMLYSYDLRNGAHVVFFRESLPKIKDNFERLQKESELALELANFLEEELRETYQRKDLTKSERQRYKYHLRYCNGEFGHVFDEQTVINGILLSDAELTCDYKLVDIHLDYNPIEGKKDSKGFSKNKSNLSYKSFVPWLRGMGFRVWSKPKSYASSSAADLLVQD